MYFKAPTQIFKSYNFCLRAKFRIFCVCVQGIYVKMLKNSLFYLQIVTINCLSQGDKKYSIWILIFAEFNSTIYLTAIFCLINLLTILLYVYYENKSLKNALITCIKVFIPIYWLFHFLYIIQSTPQTFKLYPFLF